MDLNARTLRSSWLTLPRTVVLVWALVVLGICMGRWGSVFAPVWLADSDDVMRLQQVHDLLAGQAWFDVSQHRLQPPEGGSMQWSRLADLGLAALVWIGRQVALPQMADRIAVIVYPALLMLGWLGTTVWAAARVGGRTMGYAALLAAITAASVRFQFDPGRIDHHALQLLGFLVALAAATLGTTARAGAAAGAGMALSLGTGLEALAPIAVLQLALWVRWCRGTVSAALLQGLGAGLVLATLAVVVLTLPPAHWGIAVNDGFGRGHAALLLGAGLYWLAVPHIAQRWWVSGAAGAGLVVVLALACPELVQMPYQQMDPLVRHWFLDSVQEAAPLWQFWRMDCTGALIDVGLALTGLGATAWAMASTTGAARDRWAMIGVALLTCCAIAVWQARAFAYVAMVAALPVAWLMVRLGGQPARLGQSRQRPLARVCSWLLPTALGWGMAGQAMLLVAPAAARPATSGIAPDIQRRCTLPPNFTTLAALPPGRVMALVDLGARVIAHTPHSAIAAPYHRNERGLRDAIRFFTGPPDQARQIAQADRIDYVLVCPGMDELRNYRRAAPAGMAAGLDAPPAWLRPVALPPGNPLQLWLVQR